MRSESTSLVNARAGYTFSKTIKAQLDVFNIFDRKDHDIDYFYVSRLRGGAGAGGGRPLPPGGEAGGAGDAYRGLLRPFAWVMRDSDEKG